ncbi:uncharacterized protein LOC131077993 [Cryptomeria japonica]|uniref:uncharacterized protein LOC131077993 n=1 Tax=Cryptomeria japonica TaxID=3369 RepID=UPI0027D9D02D|nr:uncharacterized protein LOC131077993 [Cryptomeria japonica]
MASKIHLISIGPSHYCEKARWGLDRAGILYQETKHVPVFHVLYTRGLGQGTSCPKLVVSEGERYQLLNESSDILQFADNNIKYEEDHLYPSTLKQSVQEWDIKFNQIVGPHVRRWSYYYLLYGKHIYQLLCQGASGWQRWLGWLLMPLIKSHMNKLYGIKRPGAKECSLEKIRQIFQEVANVLADGRPFICGDQFTAADLTFAALCGPLLWPKGYGIYQVPIEQCPTEMAEVTLSLRETLAGKHVLKMYETQRYKKVTSKELVR